MIKGELLARLEQDNFVRLTCADCHTESGISLLRFLTWCRHHAHFFLSRMKSFSEGRDRTTPI